MPSSVVDTAYMLLWCVPIILGAYIWKRLIGATTSVTSICSERLSPPAPSDRKDKYVTTKEPFTKAEEPPTLIPIEGVPNLRDFGGYASTLRLPGADHAWTRKGHLYRAAHPGGMTIAGMKGLKSLGIRFIIDLTSPDESTVTWKLSRKQLDAEGFVFIHCPMEKEKFSIDTVVERYETYQEEREEAVSTGYMELLSKCTSAIHQITKLIRDHPDAGKLIHCSLGKDRTGIVFALLLLFLDVPDSVIVKEYSLSTCGLASCITAIETYLIKFKGKDFNARLHAERMVDAREEYMTSTIKKFREVYGNASNYLIGTCGLSENDVAELRAALISFL